MFQHCQQNLPKVLFKGWSELRIASRFQKTVALPQYFLPDQSMLAETMTTYSLVQPTEIFLVYSEVPPFADLASGPKRLGASTDLFFQELAPVFGFICLQLH